MEKQMRDDMHKKGEDFQTRDDDYYFVRLHDEESEEQGGFNPAMEEGGDMFAPQFLEMLKARLKLSDKQGAKIGSILKDAQPAVQKKQEELRSLLEKMKPLQEELKNLMRDAREGVRSELKGEQKDRFDELMMQMRHHPRMPPGMMWDQRPVPEMEMRERMMRGPSERFPPEMWHEGFGQPQDKGKTKPESKP